jgi:hypothetical protein
MTVRYAQGERKVWHVVEGMLPEHRVPTFKCGRKEWVSADFPGELLSTINDIQVCIKCLEALRE